jgi:hypothetical protein
VDVNTRKELLDLFGRFLTPEEALLAVGGRSENPASGIGTSLADLDMFEPERSGNRF